MDDMKQVKEKMLRSIREDNIGKWFERTTLARIERLKQLPIHRILEVLAALDRLEEKWKREKK